MDSEKIERASRIDLLQWHVFAKVRDQRHVVSGQRDVEFILGAASAVEDQNRGVAPARRGGEEQRRAPISVELVSLAAIRGRQVDLLDFVERRHLWSGIDRGKR